MKSKTKILSAALAAALACPPALAQDNLEKLSDFRTTGTSLEIPTVPQEGKTADNLRAIAAKVNLPPGLKLTSSPSSPTRGTWRSATTPRWCLSGPAKTGCGR